MKLSKFRGHTIYKSSDIYLYLDTGEAVADTWKERSCGFCNKFNTLEGHDGCLGTLVDVTNACCGHGITKDAYAQFNNGTELRGIKAINYFKDL